EREHDRSHEQVQCMPGPGAGEQYTTELLRSGTEDFARVVVLGLGRGARAPVCRTLGGGASGGAGARPPGPGPVALTAVERLLPGPGLGLRRGPCGGLRASALTG